jgi:hypothetical protein
MKGGMDSEILIGASEKMHTKTVTMTKGEFDELKVIYVTDQSRNKVVILNQGDSNTSVTFGNYEGCPQIVLDRVERCTCSSVTDIPYEDSPYAGKYIVSVGANGETFSMEKGYLADRGQALSRTHDGESDTLADSQSPVLIDPILEWRRFRKFIEDEKSEVITLELFDPLRGLRQYWEEKEPPVDGPMSFKRVMLPDNPCSYCGKDKSEGEHSTCAAATWGSQANASLTEEEKMVNDLFDMHDKDNNETLNKLEYAGFLKAIGAYTDETIGGWISGTGWDKSLVRLKCTDGYITKKVFVKLYRGRKEVLQKDYASADKYWRYMSEV